MEARKYSKDKHIYIIPATKEQRQQPSQKNTLPSANKNTVTLHVPQIVNVNPEDHIKMTVKHV
jgi:hypothetical protein